MSKPKVSVIIPSGQEQFLAQTVADLFRTASDQIEVIVALDGAPLTAPVPPLVEHPNLHVLQFGTRRGMRACLNAAAQVASAPWLMKTDAHCKFVEGWDAMRTDCADNWVMIPRRYSLDAENWAIEQNGKGPRDYHYLSSPIWSIRERDDYSMHGLEWPQRTRERKDKPEYLIDEVMAWQGSCWFMSRAHWDRLGGLDETTYGTFAQEPQEIGNKTWLGPWDGRLMVNKAVWYAHLHKGKRYPHLWRMYQVTREEIAKGHVWSAGFWMNNKWEQRAHDLAWLIDRFGGGGPGGVPTWDADWQVQLERYNQTHTWDGHTVA